MLYQHIQMLQIDNATDKLLCDSQENNPTLFEIAYCVTLISMIENN